MKKLMIIPILMMLIVPIASAEVLDREPSLSNIFGIFQTCGDYYCSDFSPDYRLQICGDTTYKTYCGSGYTCGDGACISKTTTCKAMWLNDYYCSSFDNSRLRTYQNSDCTTTTTKYVCLSNEKCSGGQCVANQQSCTSGWQGEYYCSEFSNAQMRIYLNTDCTTTNYKYNCGTDEKCTDGECVKTTQSTPSPTTPQTNPSSCKAKTNGQDEFITDYYCSEFSNARMIQKQSYSDCSVTTLKYNCGTDEKCTDGECKKTNLTCTRAQPPCINAIWEQDKCDWNTGACRGCKEDKDCKTGEVCFNDKCSSEQSKEATQTTGTTGTTQYPLTSAEWSGASDKMLLSSACKDTSQCMKGQREDIDYNYTVECKHSQIIQDKNKKAYKNECPSYLTCILGGAGTGAVAGGIIGGITGAGLGGVPAAITAPAGAIIGGVIGTGTATATCFVCKTYEADQAPDGYCQIQRTGAGLSQGLNELADLVGISTETLIIILIIIGAIILLPALIPKKG